MTQSEIEKLLQMPLDKIAPLCTDIKLLTSVLSLAINIGKLHGKREAFEQTNTMFQGYDATTIKG